ncbi:unknown [Spodoptera litura nucleopolyhedrovirus]|uniref:Uncharacterized protein n=1 Tax=Spodoptera litura multicapsid nucleopolyhedrovirus TaxID=46242 RepID=Q91BC1_NPVST|nr:hypothetical protein [Spodoptera litura nucleopolyhedrovirus]AAL01793.1 unknown [Spodoptera litura nucleopolyhedrovirus]QHN73960.1 hypothetical protein [Spodoptera litura nucleopolyhedrovirus]
MGIDLKHVDHLRHDDLGIRFSLKLIPLQMTICFISKCQVDKIRKEVIIGRAP